MAVSTQDLKKLQDSSTLRKELNIDIKWRILTSKGGKARIVAYQDARDVQRVLDYVCGPENWSNEPRNLDGKMYMSLGINTEHSGWVYKADVGIETNIEAVKGEASDAFKRASIMWGIFRDVYDTEYIVLDVQGKYPVTPDGVLLKTPEAIGLYCNSISQPLGYLKRYYKVAKSLLEKNEDAMQAFKTLGNFTKQNFIS